MPMPPSLSIEEKRERNRRYKRAGRERLYARGLTARFTPRTISDETHAAVRAGTARAIAEKAGGDLHPRACPCYDCLFGDGTTRGVPARVEVEPIRAIFLAHAACES